VEITITMMIGDHSMKRLFIILIILLTVLTACEAEDVEYKLIYNDSEYSSVYHWYMIDDSGMDVDVHTTTNTKIRKGQLYNDNEERFISFDSTMWHKDDDELPSYEQEERIQKIVIDFYDESEDIIIDNKNDIHGIVLDINSYQENKTKDPNIESLGTIDIYYEDYPAYQFFGHLTQNEEGQYGFYILTEDSSGLISEYALFLNQEIYKNK